MVQVLSAVSRGESLHLQGVNVKVYWRGGETNNPVPASIGARECSEQSYFSPEGKF